MYYPIIPIPGFEQTAVLFDYFSALKQERHSWNTDCGASRYASVSRRHFHHAAIELPAEYALSYVKALWLLYKVQDNDTLEYHRLLNWTCVSAFTALTELVLDMNIFTCIRLMYESCNFDKDYVKSCIRKQLQAEDEGNIKSDAGLERSLDEIADKQDTLISYRESALWRNLVRLIVRQHRNTDGLQRTLLCFKGLFLFGFLDELERHDCLDAVIAITLSYYKGVFSILVRMPKLQRLNFEVQYFVDSALLFSVLKDLHSLDYLDLGFETEFQDPETLKIPRFAQQLRYLSIDDIIFFNPEASTAIIQLYRLEELRLVLIDVNVPRAMIKKQNLNYQLPSLKTLICEITIGANYYLLTVFVKQQPMLSTVALSLSCELACSPCGLLSSGLLTHVACLCLWFGYSQPHPMVFKLINRINTRISFKGTRTADGADADNP